ncbi:hypothetical protein GCM10022393_41160 [Aquimarina addita]|uniref:Guanylate cyclase domain-containing protein n=1 Tax=Aquimarina addita TaxID=870485 RepID=A0ABP6UUL2_9FLAO
METIQSGDSKKQQELLVTPQQKKVAKKKVADSLIIIGNSQIKEGNFSEALNAVQRGLMLYKSLNDHKLIGNCYNKIASIFYYQSNYLKALSYYDQSITHYETADFKKGIASSINNKGAIYYYLGNYPKALIHYKQAVKLSEILDDEKQTAATLQNIGGIYLELNDYRNAMKHFQIAKKTYERISDKKALSQVLNGIGEIHLRQEKYTNALTHFEQALQLAIEIDDKQRVLETLYNLGEIYGTLLEYEKSLIFYNRSLRLAKEIENALYKGLSFIAIGSIKNKLGKKQEATTNCIKGLRIVEDLKTVAAQKEACQCLYKVYKSVNKNGIALAYYERSISLNDSLQMKQTGDKILNMEFEKQVLMDSITQVEKRRIIQMKHSRIVQKKEKQRNIVLAISFFILILAGGIWNRLSFVRKSKAVLQIEKDLSESLLLNILPEEIAIELKQKGYVDAQDFDTASILFTDFKSFTETAAKLTPKELVEEINVCFKAFDAIMDRYGIEKIKTIGDAYMAVGGLSKPTANTIKKTIFAGIEMQEFVSKRKLENDRLTKPAFEMRVGIHTGPIVAGIVGVKKFQYDIWGDTVNTASRMESNGAVGKVNISQNTYQLVKDEKELAFEYRGKINAKGKGDMQMYFVTSKS